MVVLSLNSHCMPFHPYNLFSTFIEKNLVVIAAHTFDSNTWESETSAGDLCEFEASLVY